MYVEWNTAVLYSVYIWCFVNCHFFVVDSTLIQPGVVLMWFSRTFIGLLAGDVQSFI